MWRRTVIIREYERGLLYHHGKFVELLPPGRYRLWSWDGRQIERVDVREFSQTVEGQEILTGDKIGVRVTLIAQFRVADPITARHSVGDYQARLYQDLQLTLREAITGRTLEELLKERDALSRDLARERGTPGEELRRGADPGRRQGYGAAGDSSCRVPARG